MDLKGYLAVKIRLIENALVKNLPKKDVPKTLFRGARYSIFSGGKRIRPVLVLASCEAAGGDCKKALNAASAIEFIHTYSLIHDDLPAMDDDDLRRGKPTLHKVIGVGNAILVGDALLTLAFQILADDKKLSPDKNTRLISELSRAAGISGMVGGQAVDIAAEGKDVNRKTVEYIHSRKTGALITASCRMGGITGGADKKALNALTLYGENIGLAFQITDDILNVTGDKSKTGKATGSDVRRRKATYPSAIGVEKSWKKAQDCVNAALKVVEVFGKKGIPLRMIAESILNRVS